jgi:hypothetical protein
MNEFGDHTYVNNLLTFPLDNAPITTQSIALNHTGANYHYYSQPFHHLVHLWTTKNDLLIDAFCFSDPDV